MTALWVILSIVAWLLVGVAFARRFSVALAELLSAGYPVGLGWWFIVFWPVWALCLLYEQIGLRMIDFNEFGDRLAKIARTGVETADGLEKMARVFDDFAHTSQGIAGMALGFPSNPFPEPTQEIPQVIDGPFVLEGGKIRPAHKAQEDTPHGTDQ